MKIVTAAEMRDIDRVTTEHHNVPSLSLMENAGAAVASFVLTRYPRANRISIVCGKGNNGGDGFVAARHLHAAAKSVTVFLLANVSDLKGDAAAMFAKLPVRATELRSDDELRNALARASADLFLDAILGTGFRPPVTGLYATAIRAINQSQRSIVAVDVPSGADSDSLHPQLGDAIIRARSCVTFTAPKPVHVFGDLVRRHTVVAPIGTPDSAIVSHLGLNVITPRDYADLLRDRPTDSNKGMYGHALIVAGSYGKSGAAAMAGIGCLRSGAGLTTIATPKSVLTSVASFAPELMTEPLDETESGSIALNNLQTINELCGKMSVLAIGPGLTQERHTVELVRSLVRASSIPTVIDADGLNALAGHTDLLKQRTAPAILTPHPGEMSRLTGKSTSAIQADRITIARDFAKSHKITLVLKGARTVVASPSGDIWINCTGNPGMATGGTGDVLTGILTGLLAQHPDQPLICALAAVHLHGHSGDLARDKNGELSVIATDLITHLPEAIRVTKKSLQRRSTPLN
ncbi:MAG TPA: NAD(P)H-hydrate dehydratase [Candidatus Koribacter sp.]|jgi:NAD(P)H-hydrate epimerase